MTFLLVKYLISFQERIMVIQFCPIDIQYETQLNLKFSRNEKKKQRELTCNIFYLTYYSKYYFNIYFTLGFAGSTSGKEPACQCRKRKRKGFNPWVGKMPWRRKWQPTPVSLPGESRGQRRRESCSPWVARNQTRLKPHSTYTHNQYRNYWDNVQNIS